jgi:aminoglycoside phosphotransferase (APT) family kinase protein
MARLHVEQIALPDAVVRGLVDAQFPQWSGLELRRVPSDGTIHRVDRLGDELVVRMPFIGWAVEDVERDARRLPLLAAALPVEVPTLVAQGEPGDGMPWRWGVYRWLGGRHPVPLDDDAAVTDGLVEIVLALRAMPPVGDASPVPFDAAADLETRPRVAALHSAAALEAWDAAVSLAPNPAAPSGWLHGDLMPGNLLLRDGRVTGILDWGASGVGDLAYDLLGAWTCLGPAARRRFLSAVDATDEQVARAKGYAVRKVAWGLRYYRESLPGFAAVLSHTLAQIEASD